METRSYDLENRLVDFSSGIIDIVESLPSSRAGNYIAGQLTRSGLAPALIYGEAQSAESRDDFHSPNENCAKRIKRNQSFFKADQKKGNDKSNPATGSCLERK